MANKVIELLTIILCLIFLSIAVLIKVKSDKKRRLLVISSAEMGKRKNDGTNVLKDRKTHLTGIPSWVLALLTVLVAFIFLMVAGDIIAGIFRIRENDAFELLLYILYNLIIAGGCFYICKKDPKSIWYVPLLCNIAGIISAIIEPDFWISSIWIVICSGWILSITASIYGVQTHKKNLISAG